MAVNRLSVLGVLLPVAAMAAACDSSSQEPPCTASFAYATSIAVDPAGQPVSNLTISDTVVRTGVGFDVPQNLRLNVAGLIVVFSDDGVGKVRPAGDSIRVVGTDGNRSFSAIYRFGTDGCHWRKISGPDTVVVK